MQFPYCSPALEVYGTFGSAEQTEHDMLPDALREAGFDPVGSMDFNAFVTEPLAGNFVMDNVLAHEREMRDNFFLNAESGPLMLHSELGMSTPPPLLQDEDHTVGFMHAAQMSIQSSGNVSDLSYALPASPVSYMEAQSPAGLGNLDIPSNEENSCGLLERSRHGSAFQPSMAPFSLFDIPLLDLPEAQGNKMASMPTEGHSFLSPAIHTSGQYSFTSGLPSPFEDYMDFSPTTPLSQSLVCITGSEAKGEAEKSCLRAPFVTAPERVYLSPSPTPEKLTVPLPSRSSSKVKRGKVHPTCSKSVDDFDSNASVPSCTSPTSATGKHPHGHSKRSKSTSDGAGLCGYGSRVLSTDSCGRRVVKWKCKSCGTLTGRRPDLHRHYKTCVTREKYFCIDVVHADGSVWVGCGMKFSRRDACHRHLKRRLTEGRCSKAKPKKTQCLSEADYEAKFMMYEDMLVNAKWRAALPAAEKNRLAMSALSNIKQDMF